MAASDSSGGITVGMPVVVVRVGETPPPQYRGEIVNLRSNGLAVRLAVAAPFVPGEAVLVIVVASAPRLAVRARFAAAQGNLCALQTEGEWRSLEARRHTRHPLEIEAEVRSVLGTSRQPGSIVNISPGGASVAVTRRPGGRQIELGVAIAGYSATLPGEVVGVTETEGSITLHLRFGELSPAQQAFLRHVIGLARAAAENRGELAS